MIGSKSWTDHLRILAWFFSAVLVLTAVMPPRTVRAAVVFSDGFGDADIDNNGVALEGNDVDMTLIGEPSYEPPEFVGSTVNILTTVEDASDVGLPWFSSRGWTTSGTPYPKGNIKIMDDASAAFPETPGVSALDDGYAMAFESKGRGSSVTAMFGQQVALGPEVGDQVKVGFDFRVWQSAPNANNFTPPILGELRFGLYQDTDNQLGQSNPFAGAPDSITGIPTAAVWGEENGHFRGDSIGLGPGAIGDHGWYASAPLGDVNDPFGPLPNGPDARINEETNEEQVPGDTSSIKFLEGPDNDFVTKPDSLNPDFVTMDSTKPYRLELTLERATDTDPGDTIMAIFQITDLTTSEVWTLSGQEPLTNSCGDGCTEPDGISSDSWDYFAIRNTGADDFDFLLDNFQLEIFGSNAPGGIDFDNNGVVDCADVDALVAEIVAGTDDGLYDVDGNGVVDNADLNQWLVDAGNLNVGGAYLPGDATLDGVVDVSDFNIWNASKFNAIPAWCSGDFNADGSVDVSDFNTWNGNKFQSSSPSAVPEPGTSVLLIFASMLVMAGHRRHR